MSLQAVLVPLFVQVGLTFALMFWMGTARVRSVRRGETKVRDIALGQPNWPAPVQQITNCYHNQYQLPVLFYVLAILAIPAHKADLLFVAMSWVFVASRIVHAAIHTTSNDVGHRFSAFAIGAFVLLVMWIIFMVRILLGLP
jgi:hypothetical protein